MSEQVLSCIRASSTDRNPARQIEAIGEVEDAFTGHLSGASRAERTALAAMPRHARQGAMPRGLRHDRRHGCR